MKPTADELKDKPEEVRVLVAETLGWTCVSRSYLTGLPPHLKVEQYSSEQVLNNEVPVYELPYFEISHDACRTFEDAMSEEEFRAYLFSLWRIVYPDAYAREKSRRHWPDFIEWNWMKAIMQATPLQKCLAFLLTKSAINP